MKARFTLDGSNALEERLEELCTRARDKVLAIIPSGDLEALVLGGGYGRGEGGVLRTGSGEQPYNDMEFYALLRGSEFLTQRRVCDRIHHAAEELTALADIDVEFKLLALRKIERSPVTMFYYDLISGHRMVQGDDAWLARCQHHRSAHRIPLHEATRLLMNRCSGLLFAQERLARADFRPEDGDFVGRNLAKAKLAFGDVILAMRGQYHSSCRERYKRLRKLEPEPSLPSFSSLLPLHEQGVEFKLHPVRDQRNIAPFNAELKFLKEIGRELWLYLESKRLARAFDSIALYCHDPHSKCPETTPLKNRLINLRTFGPSCVLDSRYPRERLLRALPVLLWDEALSPSQLSLIQQQLRSSSADFMGLVRAYEAIWRIYN
ncbi:MAG TPA: hypothetical protein VGR78_05150 [Verrucomicrobiae bacterium]|nr:hypothetical protein [Verrucomicrobiae bacterium]